MRHVEVTMKIVLDATEEKDATGEQVAEALMYAIEEMAPLWLHDDTVAYEVRFAGPLGVKVAKETRAGLT